MCQGRLHRPLGSHLLFISLFHFKIQNNTCFPSHKKADDSCDMEEGHGTRLAFPRLVTWLQVQKSGIILPLVLPGSVQPHGALPEGTRQQTSHWNPSPVRQLSDGPPDVSSARSSRVPVCPPGCMGSISPGWPVVILICPDGQFPWLLKISATLIFGRFEEAASLPHKVPFLHLHVMTRTSLVHGHQTAN